MAYERIHTREGGEKVRIVVTNFALPGLKPDVSVEVFTQDPDGLNWCLCKQQSMEEKRESMTMSVDEYIKKGRPPMFYAVTPAEILKASTEARLCGWQNPDIDAALHFSFAHGRDATIPVVVNTAKGLLEVGGQEFYATLESTSRPFTDTPTGQHLQVGGRRFELEIDHTQRLRVTDLSGLQDHCARALLDRQRRPDRASPGPR